MKKLVFVEGVSGVGKSTTAVKLCDALIDLGFRTVCHLEGDADNPVWVNTPPKVLFFL